MNDYVRSLLDQADGHLQKGSLSSAHFALKKVFRRQPGNIDALLINAELLHRDGRRTESEDAAISLFDRGPRGFSDNQRKRLAHVCFENELYALAIDALDGVDLSGKNDALSLYELGSSLYRLGRTDVASQHLQQSVRARPDIAAPYLQLGHLYKSMGEPGRAEHYYKKFLARTKRDRGTGWWCLADLGSYRFDAGELAAIGDDVDRYRDNPLQLAALHFALGRDAEHRQAYNEAARYYTTANAKQSEVRPFDAKQYRAIVDDLSTVGAGEKREASGERPVAILVVGLPRSGTTLVERILGAHSRIEATDELPYLEKIALRLEMQGGYSKRMQSLSADECGYLRRQYVNGANAWLRGTPDYFVDKYPGNFLHVGLAKRIMPDCKIIDVRRDPRDVAVSAYRQMFNVRNEFATSFDGIVEYSEGYIGLVEHWKSVYPGQILTLHYESLVSSPDESIRDLLDYCGLDDEKACHEFYRFKRPVRTPSVAQVSKPVYTSSIGQWRRYEEWFGPQFERLSTIAVQAR